VLGLLCRGLQRAGRGKKLIEAAELLARGHLQIDRDDDLDDQPHDDQANALAALGLVLDGEGTPPVPEDEFHLWPEHERALHCYLACQSQWRRDFGDRIGLDYQGVQAVIARRFRLQGSEADELFCQLQAMERAALDEWARQHAARHR
jgi:hypothetical protein